MKNNQPSLIFVTGGVLSSIGKGIIAASLGSLLEESGFKVSIVKADPYLNLDSGTMSPFQHGEVFVTQDGAETDLDLGSYERFLNRSLKKENHMTSGKIYHSVIQRERRGEYLGSTVQVIPHITNEIKKQILEQDDSCDIIIVEIGGTIGDIESLPFLEAVRQLRFEVPRSFCIHVTLVPYIASSGELKTKPTQHSVKELRSLGLNADMIICRSEKRISEEARHKIALFANLPSSMILDNPDHDSIYFVPEHLEKQQITSKICQALGLAVRHTYSPLIQWNVITRALASRRININIAIVGKYSDLTDAYKSINEALLHASLPLKVLAQIIYIPAETLEEPGADIAQIFSGIHGVLVPGGFGSRGIEGKINTATYCRENKVPYFGICLGMQLAVIEWVRNVIGINDANSAEFTPHGKNNVFSFMTDWIDMSATKHQRSEREDDKGGTMRLGSYVSYLKASSKAGKIYAQQSIVERHRHRFELNPKYIHLLEKSGMVISARSEQDLVEMVEIPNHPWFIGTQFHPEFQSKPRSPHPLFLSFIQACVAQMQHSLGLDQESDDAHKLALSIE
jgi:CTP synthase